MPGNPRIVKVQLDTLKNDPLILPAYARLIIKYVLDYVARKFGVSGAAETLEELEELLLKIAEEYPAEEAVAYGIYKGESMLAGAVGTIARRFGKEAPKKLAHTLGVMETLKGSESLYDCLSRYKAFLTEIGFMRDEDLTLEDSVHEVFIKLHGQCTYVNACTQLHQEGVYNVFGSVPCGRFLAFAGIADAALNKKYDVKITKYNPPNCEGKIFEIP
ncbi:MAG: hypothetical protein ACUVXA_01695 [Candidatus Jordarchaeum sp.]|uniref:hypothetical protein n=1 Tax=Candidatus Jordarchaeum sp. TaxID=2823881 RepID=UPI004048FAC7